MVIAHPQQALSVVQQPVNWDAELFGAKMLHKSGLAPSALKSPESVLFVILAGRDLGLSPTASLRSINVIQGKVEVGADMQLSLFKRAGGTATWLELTDTVAELKMVHPNGDCHTERFTMEDAKRAKLGGDNWSKYPKAMLRSRCITAGMKSIGFEVLAGVYGAGEISGDDGAEVIDSQVVATLIVPAQFGTVRAILDTLASITELDADLGAKATAWFEGMKPEVLENQAIAADTLGKLRARLAAMRAAAAVAPTPAAAGPTAEELAAQERAGLERETRRTIGLIAELDAVEGAEMLRLYEGEPSMRTDLSKARAALTHLEVMFTKMKNVRTVAARDKKVQDELLAGVL